ncbi:MAG: hypothetical protein L0Z50_08985 [Verrucomicrobiales bacterium]|nr:hypothetical protein [Verrucomicrobiales bacterium]
MGLFKKKDPISERARALNAEIASLEAQIQKLGSQLQKTDSPRLRSTALPSGQRATPTPAPTSRQEPVFEANDYQKNASLEPAVTPQHFNDLGMRKYDLVSALRRLQVYFRGPPTHNPKLVSYLAAGSIKGLRPLRYEKRVARNRFIALCVVLVLIAWGIAAVILRQ